MFQRHSSERHTRASAGLLICPSLTCTYEVSPFHPRHARPHRQKSQSDFLLLDSSLRTSVPNHRIGAAWYRFCARAKTLALCAYMHSYVQTVGGLSSTTLFASSQEDGKGVGSRPSSLNHIFTQKAYTFCSQITKCVDSRRRRKGSKAC